MRSYGTSHACTFSIEAEKPQVVSVKCIFQQSMFQTESASTTCREREEGGKKEAERNAGLSKRGGMQYEDFPGGQLLIVYGVDCLCFTI